MQDEGSKLPRRDYFQNTLQNTFIIKNNNWYEGFRKEYLIEYIYLKVSVALGNVIV